MTKPSSATSKNSYSEKLKDPRWQKKRLEIFERDDWKCRGCGDDSVTLNAHHLWYFHGSEPWDIQNNFLVTLCEKCHEIETENAKHEKNRMLYHFARLRVNSRGFKAIADALSTISEDNVDPIDLIVKFIQSTGRRY